ncbi:MAG: SMC-Scp complex subunit ScpB [Planctomycetota bacterium]|jgi:segregation and condensation protein B|nr:SMC-Scp complex subunit ScpB [Planctomycetota bacterium]MDP7637229.1 SMC-Scp complex subunit ScpB [Phycisphaerae bacterium]
MSDSKDNTKNPTGQEAPADVAAAVEAILFSTDTPLTAAKIVQVAELSGHREVTRAVEKLNTRYERTGSTFRIESVAGGYRMQTLSRYHDVLSRLFSARSDTRLSQAAMETLSIVAYRQPILRADIEAIRGVACGEVLHGLLEKQLIRIVGRAEVLGRPMLYGTTRRFLEVFGLKDLDDLPRVAELRAPAEPVAAANDSSTRSESEQNKPTQDGPQQPEEPGETGADSPQ